MSALDLINTAVDVHTKSVLSDEMSNHFNELMECSIDETYLNALETSLSAYNSLSVAYGMLCESIDKGELSVEAYKAYNLAIEAALPVSRTESELTLSLEAGKKDDSSLLRKAASKMKDIAAAIWKVISKGIDAISDFYKRYLTVRGRMSGAIVSLKTSVKALDGETFEGTLDLKLPNMYLNGRLQTVAEMSDALAALSINRSTASSLFSSVLDSISKAKVSGGELDAEDLNKGIGLSIGDFAEGLQLKKSNTKIKGLPDDTILYLGEVLPGGTKVHLTHSPSNGVVNVGYYLDRERSDDSEALRVLSKSDMLNALEMLSNEMANRDKMASDVLTVLKDARKGISKLAEDNMAFGTKSAMMVAYKYSMVIGSVNRALTSGTKLNTIYMKTLLNYVQSSYKFATKA